MLILYWRSKTIFKHSSYVCSSTQDRPGHVLICFYMFNLFPPQMGWYPYMDNPILPSGPYPDFALLAHTGITSNSKENHAPLNAPCCSGGMKDPHMLRITMCIKCPTQFKFNLNKEKALKLKRACYFSAPTFLRWKTWFWLPLSYHMI